MSASSYGRPFGPLCFADDVSFFFFVSTRNLHILESVISEIESEIWGPSPLKFGAQKEFLDNFRVPSRWRITTE